MAGVADFFKNIFKGFFKTKKKETPDTAMALEILTWVQEAMDHRDDPEALTAALGRIQQIANSVLGETTRLLTGPNAAEIEVLSSEEVEIIDVQFKPGSADGDVSSESGALEAEPDVEAETVIPERVNEQETEQMPKEDAASVCEETLKPVDEVAVSDSVSDISLQQDEADTAEIPDETGSESVAASETKAADETGLEENMEEVVETEAADDEADPGEMPGIETEFEELMHPERFAGKRLLYAYGNAPENGLIKQTCESWDIVIDTVPTGLAAVKQFSASEAGTYDAIIMEKSMPLMNGFMAAKCIRKDKHDESETIPIIVAAFDSQTSQEDKAAEWVSACMCESSEREIYNAFSVIWPEHE